MEMIVQHPSATPSARSAKHNYIHHMSQFWLWKGCEPGTKEGLKVWNISGWKIREIQKHSLFTQRLNLDLA